MTKAFNKAWVPWEDSSHIRSCCCSAGRLPCSFLSYRPSTHCDCSVVSNQNLAVNLAQGMGGMTVAGGNGILILSQIRQVYQADCDAAERERSSRTLQHRQAGVAQAFGDGKRVGRDDCPPAAQVRVGHRAGDSRAGLQRIALVLQLDQSHAGVILRPMTDAEFLQALAKGSYPRDMMDHRAHLRLALLFRDDPQGARDLLVTYVTKIGGLVKYNETLTQVWLKLVSLHPETTVDALMKTPLADSSLPFRHYSPERLWSDEARARFRRDRG